MKTRILLIGAGAHAGVVLDILSHYKDVEVVGFADSNTDLHGKKTRGMPVLGDDSVLEDENVRKKFDRIIITLGGEYAKARGKIWSKIKELGLEGFTAIHPSAIISSRTEIGEGSVVMAGSIINPGARIGDNCCVNTGAIIEHDNILESGSFIQPNATLGGNVKIGKNAVVGMHSTVLEKRKVGSNSIVGAGAVVTKDVPDNTVVVGIPAKKMRDN